MAGAKLQEKVRYNAQTFLCAGTHWNSEKGAYACVRESWLAAHLDYPTGVTVIISQDAGAELFL